ncbi:MAG: PEP-CTERM sorting domain-containing protein [Phycisphaerae bacterium]
MQLRTILASVAVLGLAATVQAAPQLGAWWSFNNSWSSNRGDGLWTGGGGFHHTTIPGPNFDDGIWTGPTTGTIGAGIQGDLLLPVYDGFTGQYGSGILVNTAGIDNAPQSLAGRTQIANNIGNFGAYIDVSNVVGANNGNMNANTWGSFQGTGVNRPSGTFAGGSLAITGSANNGSYFDIVIDPDFNNGQLPAGSAWEISGLTWAQQGTGTGYNSRTYSYSLDGVSFVEIGTETGTLGTFAANTNFADLSLLSVPEGVVAFRVEVDGATSTNGNHRFDNIQLFVDSYVIPEPASMSLLGLAGLGLARRRRA